MQPYNLKVSTLMYNVHLCAVIQTYRTFLNIIKFLIPYYTMKTYGGAKTNILTHNIIKFIDSARTPKRLTFSGAASRQQDDAVEGKEERQRYICTQAIAFSTTK